MSVTIYKTFTLFSGHVTPKDCFPYVEHRSQFGTPKQKSVKLAEAIREADEIISSQEQEQQQQPQSGRKRAAPKSREKGKSTSEAAETVSTPSPAKKPRGRPPRAKSETETEQPAAAKAAAASHHEDEELITTEKLLPASQLAEIAASTVFESEADTHPAIIIGDAADKTQSSPLRGTVDPDEEDEEDVDDAISNVVRQLEELEKQEADEQRRNQAGASPAAEVSSPQSGYTPSTEPKRRGRPPRKGQAQETSEPSSILTRPRTLETEPAKNPPGRVPHKRSLSETTDDGNAANVGFARQSSGSETPLSGGEGGSLGKRRHKPKIMSEYFLEYDYASPRTHRKSESSAPATAATTPSSSSQPTKSQQQQKTPKSVSVERTPKVAATRGKKAGATGSGTKSTKDMEKAALEAEIERVKMAAEENQTEQQTSSAADQPFWQRPEAFGDLPFDDSMLEFTVDVEETPAGGASNQASFGGETSAPMSQAMAKRRREAQEIAREKERERQKQKQKLKVKLLKGLLPPPKVFAGAGASGPGRKKKEKALAVVLPKKKPMGVGKMKVKIAKKRATKAAKVVAAAELKVKKKRGRKPLSETKPKHEKRVTGYSLWAEREMETFRQEHPDVKGLKNVREMLQAKYQQLSETEKTVRIKTFVN